MDKIVIKLSGSIFDTEDKTKIRKTSEMFRKLYDDGILKGVVVGGGNNAKKYISMVRNNNYLKDIIGIYTSRLHAFVLSSFLKDIAYFPIPIHDEELLRAANSGKLIISGGITPGQSTDAVAMKLAELLDIRTVVFVSNVDGLYDKDPKIYRDAKFIEKISYNNLKSFVNTNIDPGNYQFIDPLAINIGERSRIKIIIMSYEDIERIYDILERKKNLRYTEVIP